MRARVPPKSNACRWIAATLITVGALACDGNGPAEGAEPNACTSAFDCEALQACLGGTCQDVQPPTILTDSLPVAELGQPYLASLEAEGGVGRHTWSLDAGAPAWLILGEDSGQLSGVPDVLEPEGLSVTVRVADLRDNQDQANLTLVVRECRPGVEATCVVSAADRCLVGGVKTCGDDGAFGACDATEPSSDPSTCGPGCASCDATRAPNCVDGACTCGGAAPCGEGLACCDGTCVDLLSDPDHCRACDFECRAPDATMECLAGECVMQGCASPDVADCDPQQPGCETDLRTSNDHCGTCHAPCGPDASTHVETASCEARTCVVATCETGWADCDDLTPGCETDATAAVSCGGCAEDGGLSCFGDHVTDATCESGACVPFCDGGWADCDDDPTACEIALGTTTDCTTCADPCTASSLCYIASCLGWSSGCSEVAKSCNDNEACTYDDYCDTATGDCVNTADITRYCTEHGWGCGIHDVTDCPSEGNQVACGSCASVREVCAAGGSCVDACTNNSWGCGSHTVTDMNGNDVIVSCGTCTEASQYCAAPGSCVGICSHNNWECGSQTVTDVDGNSVSDDCGTCPGGETCLSTGRCDTCVGGWGTFCKERGGMCLITCDSITCAYPCGGPCCKDDF